MVAINWLKISRWSAPDLTNLDVVIANLLCALGLPGAQAVSVDECRRTLDQWAARVRHETERLGYQFQRNPGAYQNSEAHFRMMILVTVLQRDFGVHSHPKFSTMQDCWYFRNPKNLFVHGVVQDRLGSCASLPPTYAAVGRRLGYPLKLATAFQHRFLRWDGPTGERFNIETTSSGLVCHPDIYYQHWPRKLSDDQVRKFNALQSLSPQQELAIYIGNRGHVFAEHENLPEAVLAYAHTAHLYPEDVSWRRSLVTSMGRCERRLQSQMVRGLPPMTVHFPPRMFANIPLTLEQEIFHQQARDLLLNNAALKEKWWQPMRKNPKSPPPDLPVRIHAHFPKKFGDTVRFLFDHDPSDGYDPRHIQFA